MKFLIDVSIVAGTFQVEAGNLSAAMAAAACMQGSREVSKIDIYERARDGSLKAIAGFVGAAK